MPDTGMEVEIGVNADVDEATEAIRDLGDAIDDVNAALERLYEQDGTIDIQITAPAGNTAVSESGQGIN